PLAAQLRRRWECRTLAARFGDAGYRTAAVVSNALLSHVERESGRQTFADGFQSWNGLLREEGWNGLWGWKRRDTWLGWITALTGLQVAINRPLHKLFRSNAVRPVRQHLGEGEVTAANALRWLDDLLAAPRPYFFLVHFMDPHSPYIPPPPYRGTVSDPSILPPGTDVSNRGEFELREIPGKILSGAWRGSRDEARAFARFDHDRYREEVLYLDAMVGRILERVRRSGRPTYILFTADHGEAFGEHDFMEHGTSVYEEEIAVPFVLNGPKVPAGHKLEQAPDLVDAGFTLLSLAGADTAHADGRNVLEGKTRPPTLVLINENRARNAALIDEPWKLVCGLDYGPDPRPGRFELTPRALFNLAEDPGETKDLLPSREDVAQTMLAVLRARLDKDLFPFLEKRHLSPEERADLSQLGYLSFGIPEDESDDPHEERK
ncbi:MAG: sulfatase, partial [Planctomycetota bacterium]